LDLVRTICTVGRWIDLESLPGEWRTQFQVAACCAPGLPQDVRTLPAHSPQKETTASAAALQVKQVSAAGTRTAAPVGAAADRPRRTLPCLLSRDGIRTGCHHDGREQNSS